MSCSRTQIDIDDSVEAIKKILADVFGVKCDVSVSSQFDSLVKKTIEKSGSFDILVNDAGIAFVKKLADASEKEWDETLGSNLKNAFLCCKTVLPYIFNNNAGTIINVSSGAGKDGFDSLFAYCASKFCMMGLTESLAWEIGGHQIRVMSIRPGEVATKM